MKANLTEPFKQDIIKLQVNTKDIKREDRLCMKSPLTEA